MAMPDLTVAITGFGGLDNPEPGFGVASALRDGWRGGLEIHALGYDAWMTAAWLPGLVDHLHRMPTLSHGRAALLDRILELHQAHSFDALIPCLDLEVRLFAAIARELHEAGIRVLMPGPERLDAVSKTALPLFCYEHDILTPHTIHVGSSDHVPMYADQLGYPLMVKGTVADAIQVMTPDEAKLEAAKANSKWGIGAILQRPVQGEEYVVAMVARGDGSLLSLLPLRKLARDRQGKGMIGVVVDDPDLIRDAKAILERLDWAGPLELEFVRERATGRLNLIEINCRFPSWIGVAHRAGANLPVALLREMMEPGIRIRGQARPGTAYIRVVEDMAVPARRATEFSRFGTTRSEPASPAVAKRVGEGLRVAVTGMSTLDVVMPGLGVARALGMSDTVSSVIGLGYGPNDTALYMPDLVQSGHALPDSAEPELLLDRLREIRRDHPFDVVLPCLDLEVPRFAAIADEMGAEGMSMLLPSVEAAERVSKLRLFVEQNRHNWGVIDLPDTLKVWTLQGIDRAAEEIGFPMQIKGPVSGSTTVYDVESARAAWLRLREKGWREALAQAHVEGDHVSVAGLCDAESELVGSLAIKKAARCRHGSTWGAAMVDQPGLIESFAAFLSEIGWQGPVEGEFIRDALTDRYQLIEVNPRFPAWIAFAAQCGVNLPEMAVRLAAGMDAPMNGVVRDTFFARACVDRPLAMRDFARMATQGVVIHE